MAHFLLALEAQRGNTPRRGKEASPLAPRPRWGRPQGARGASE